MPNMHAGTLAGPPVIYDWFCKSFSARLLPLSSVRARNKDSQILLPVNKCDTAQMEIVLLPRATEAIYCHMVDTPEQPSGKVVAMRPGRATV